ncbi:MAG: hypothetical protein KIS85_09370 [Anaerolineales bacterium]|nr:hypothetical protein [Anaerolineales bacterium]
MEFVSRMRQIGSILFVLMWLPFLGIFVGLAGEMGDAGRSFAAWVDQYLPGLLSLRGSQISILTGVSMALTMGMMLAAMLLIFGAPFLAGFLNRRILRSGEPATAEVLSVENTGTYINSDVLVRVSLEVQPEGRTPFNAETERLASYALLARLEPGAMVRVRFDTNSLEVALED